MIYSHTHWRSFHFQLPAVTVALHVMDVSVRQAASPRLAFPQLHPENKKKGATEGGGLPTVIFVKVKNATRYPKDI